MPDELGLSDSEIKELEESHDRSAEAYRNHQKKTKKTPAKKAMGRAASKKPTAVCCPDCSAPLTIDFQRQRDSNSGTTGNEVSVWDTSKRRRKSMLDKINLSLFQSSTEMEALMEVSC